MNTEEIAAFNEADKVVHKVEDQWHYKYLVAAGFVPETKEAVGFVRAYLYKHADGRTVRVVTGRNADYWDSSDKQGGYWSDLERYCATR